MDDAQHKRRNAEPFMQAVHLVEAAKPTFRPARPKRKQHAKAHAADREDARELDHDRAERKKPRRLKNARLSPHKEQSNYRKVAPECTLQCPHSRVPPKDAPVLNRAHLAAVWGPRQAGMRPKIAAKTPAISTPEPANFLSIPPVAARAMRYASFRSQDVARSRARTLSPA